MLLLLNLPSFDHLSFHWLSGYLYKQWWRLLQHWGPPTMIANFTRRTFANLSIKAPNVAIVLSGSGVYDGSEITEGIVTLVHLSRFDATFQCYAPDKMQLHAVDHTTGTEHEESRNVYLYPTVPYTSYIHTCTVQLSWFKSYGAYSMNHGCGSRREYCHTQP